MDKMGMVLEMELGITGGEEDGVNNEDVDKDELYSKPEEIHQVYEALSPISDKFTVAAAFGNVHGVYAGDIELRPPILDSAQKYITEKLGAKAPKDKKVRMREERIDEVAVVCSIITCVISNPTRHARRSPSTLCSTEARDRPSRTSARPSGTGASR